MSENKPWYDVSEAKGRIPMLASNFKYQCVRHGRTMDDRQNEILRKIEGLDVATATMEDVAAIGMEGWVAERCQGCKVIKDYVLLLGENEDYESRTAYLCRECLGEIIRSFDAGEWKSDVQ